MSWFLLTADVMLTADVTEELALGQKLLKAAPQSLLDLLIRVVFCIVAFLIGSRIISFIRKLTGNALRRANASKEAKQFLDSSLKVGLYAFLIFQIAVKLGIDATTIATVIGSATVTIGLAFQGSLKNCIGGILIMLLHPFRVGDYIIEDNHKNEGTVSEITIFYTKLATIDNKIILLPNGALADTSITNVTNEDNRRVELKVGISYQADIRKAKAVITSLIEANEKILKDKEYSIFVDDLGDSSVVLGMRFWTRTEDFWPVRWAMLEDIKYAFDENGIGIPFPQMDVHLDAVNEGKA
ncbi:mechanosensitive ion channel family protein [Eisenbergiella sp.]